MNVSTMTAGMEFVRTLGQELDSGTLDLPTFPDVALRVRDVINDENCSAERLAKVLGADPVLAAKVINVANSAAYARGGIAVTDLRVATSRLGHAVLRNTALAFAMQQLTSVNANAALRKPLREIWRHSVQVAAIAFALTKHLTKENPEEAMLAGLVHDIGKIYILTRAAKLPELFEDPEAVQDCVDQWHAGVGRAIVEDWKFPENVVEAVDEHELLEHECLGKADLTSIVIVANLLAKIDAGAVESVDWDEVPSFQKLTLTAEKAEAILSESANEIQSLVDALKV